MKELMEENILQKVFMPYISAVKTFCNSAVILQLESINSAKKK